MGNIVNGTELGRRVANKELFGLTAPLITTASGAKMGKTAAGAVWLNPSRLSPYEYWQYWRNVEDADVGRFLKLFTDVPLNANFQGVHQQSPSPSLLPLHGCGTLVVLTLRPCCSARLPRP